MENKKIIFWMNCYGGWDPNLRQPIETIGYDQYLDAFVKSASLFRDRIETIYISGGMYDSLGRTECETTKPELENRFKKIGLNLEIKTDEKSVTSQMILLRFLNTWRENYPNIIPLLFVDESRYETNLFTFEYYTNKLGINLNARDVIVPLPRLDNHPHSTREFQAKKIQKMKEVSVEEVANLEMEARKEHLDRKRKQ